MDTLWYNASGLLLANDIYGHLIDVMNVNYIFAKSLTKLLRESSRFWLDSRLNIFKINEIKPYKMCQKLEESVVGTGKQCVSCICVVAVLF